MDRFEVAKVLENFLEGSGGPWDWDDFTQGMSLKDPELEAIRRRCAGLGTEFPATSPNHYCGEEGLKVLRSYITSLREKWPCGTG
ncbi:MAG TPA: hypothetical protein VKT33_08590 [Candidatus Angelobacter sp.]|nr:hypothetical protein [Candidatus Angelobacter sp.]